MIPFFGTQQKLHLGIRHVVEAQKYSDTILGKKQYCTEAIFGEKGCCGSHTMIPFSGTDINQPILNVMTRDIVETQLYHFLEQSADAISWD